MTTTPELRTWPNKSTLVTVVDDEGNRTRRMVKSAFGSKAK